MHKNKLVQSSDLNKIDRVIRNWLSVRDNNTIVDSANNLIRRYPLYKEHIEKSLDDVLKKIKEEQKVINQEKLLEQQTNGKLSNSEQFLKKETGAVPKRRKHSEEKREQHLQKQEEKRYKKNREQKREEQQEKDEQAYYNFEYILDQYFKMVTVSMASSLFISTKDKQDGIYYSGHKKYHTILTFSIKAYYIAILLNKLLDGHYIKIDLIKLPMCFKKELSNNFEVCQKKFMFDYMGRVPLTVIYERIKQSNASQIFLDKFYGPMQAKLFEYGVKIPNITYLDIPDVKNIEGVECDLINEVNTLVERHYRYYQGEFENSLSVLLNKRNFKDICKFLDNVMKKNNYLVDVDSLIQKYQDLPNSKMKEASARLGSHMYSKN